MRIDFSEFIRLPVQQVFGYFQSPAEWVRLYGLVGTVEHRGQGWYTVPLQSLPFPLVARVTALEPLQFVAWRFRGFWRGGGEVRFAAQPGGVQVDGYEEISARWLPGLSWILERLLMEREFRRIWSLGWRRLRSQETEQAPTAS
jgi:hypothetical protein